MNENKEKETRVEKYLYLGLAMLIIKPLFCFISLWIIAGSPSMLMLLLASVLLSIAIML